MASVDTIRVLIVDDHDMFAESLARILGDEPDIQVAGKAGSCTEAVQLAAELRPGVAIVDFRLPDSDGLTATSGIRSVSPETRILMLTGVGDSRLVTSAIEAGCSGFLTKDKAVRELVAAVRLVHSGEAYLSPAVLGDLLPRLGRGYRVLGADMTIREREVLQLLAAGRGNKEMARQLHLSVHTIRNHVQNVLVKLGAHSKLEAVVLASRSGLVDTGGPEGIGRL